jgi:type VI secretion system protein ImpE
VNAKELISAGDLASALDEVNRQVKANPADTGQRTLLFEILCFAGDHVRAERQLDIIAQLDANADVGAQIYRNALCAERLRDRLRSEGLAPSFILEPPPFVTLYLEAFNRLREGRPAEARALLERAAETEQTVSGQVNGQPFADISDCDPFLGPVLELIIHDRYVWLPFVQIMRLTVSAPKKLRDLVWIPAELESIDGPIGGAFIPVLYCGSWTHAEDQVRLGRATHWAEIGSGLVRGYGQRLLLIGEEERAVLQVGQITLDSSGTRDLSD